MSTRANIGFYEVNETSLENHKVILYHHCDGYPTHLLVHIAKTLISANKPTKQSIIGNSIILLESTDGGEYEKTDSIHGDIEYFYAIYTDGTIKTYTMHGLPWDAGYDRCNTLDWHLLSTNNLSDLAKQDIDKLASLIEKYESDLTD